MSGPFDDFLRMAVADCVNARTEPSQPGVTCWLCKGDWNTCGHCDEGCEECRERYEADRD